MSLLTADRYVARIELIDLDELYSQGIRCILFDRDNTVVPRNAHEAPASVHAWLERARTMGFACAMVSNNWFRSHVQRSARELKVQGIHSALKPLPFNIRKACKAAGVTPHNTVLIGDQLFTDILGGNLAGVSTIMVRPQCDTDIVPMRYLRRFENFLTRNAVFEGEETEHGN